MAQPGRQSREERQALLALLGRFISEPRRRRMAEVLDARTRHVTILLEDIYQPQNASAALRTCDALGVQDVHVVENWNAYRLNPDVSLGAEKWLTLHRWRAPGRDGAALAAADAMPESFPATEAAMQALRARGYTLVATSPHADARTPDELPLERPLAFLFGNEREGLSPCALEGADLRLRLPMYGFAESYNISVSVAITLFAVLERLRRSPVPWRLGEEEREALLLEWYRRSVPSAAALERDFRRRRGASS